MTLSDSRRLTGPNLLLDGPGAAAEITLPNAKRDQAVEIWKTHLQALLDAIDWQDEVAVVRPYEGGVTLAITAPPDALYSATDVVEAAWELTRAEIDRKTGPDFNRLVKDIRQEIADEVNPALIQLATAASAHDVTLLSDDGYVTLGFGKGSQTWPRDSLPVIDDVDWDKLTDIPVALVTGTNGKSTTTRIAASIGAAAGLTVGFSSSDWVKSGDDTIASGDYSGPEGARLALRDQRVDMAVIETARGGLLRRGLPIAKATACLITNVAADHLGEYGIHDVEALADAKFTVSKAVTTSGTLILNADDARLKTRGAAFTGNLAWYGLSLSEKDCSAEGFSAFVQDDILMLWDRGQIIPILPVAEFGPALGGAASYNVSNALGAILLMHVMGVDAKSIKQGLINFDSDLEDNPGRGNFMEIGGVKLILDFAHNPHGLSALTQALSAVPAKRRLYLCGQAGDRSDDDIYGMTRVIRDANPDTIIIKDLPKKLRGRKLGDVPILIQKYLSEMDYPKDKILSANSELEATVKAFEWAQPGDLLVLLVYSDRKNVLDLVQKLKANNWQVGDPVKL